ncbi:protein dmr6-like oxygenase 1, partial [Quercus suber]
RKDQNVKPEDISQFKPTAPFNAKPKFNPKPITVWRPKPKQILQNGKTQPYHLISASTSSVSDPRRGDVDPNSELHPADSQSLLRLAQSMKVSDGAGSDLLGADEPDNEILSSDESDTAVRSSDEPDESDESAKTSDGEEKLHQDIRLILQENTGNVSKKWGNSEQWVLELRDGRRVAVPIQISLPPGEVTEVLEEQTQLALVPLKCPDVVEGAGLIEMAFWLKGQVDLMVLISEGRGAIGRKGRDQKEGEAIVVGGSGDEHAEEKHTFDLAPVLEREREREREREPGEASTIEIGGGSVWWSWRSIVMGSGYGGLYRGLAFTMKVSNHGISEAVIDHMLDISREFFHMPESERLKNYFDDPMKTMRLSTNSIVTLWRTTSRNGLPTLHPLEELLVSTVEMQEAGLALRLLEAISESLGLDEDYRDEALGKHEELLVKNLKWNLAIYYSIVLTWYSSRMGFL